MNPNSTNIAHDGQPDVDGGRGSKPRRLGLRHDMGRDWYLFKVELHLDGKVSGRHRESILAELKDSIDAESQVSPLADVLAGLGRPREWSASYNRGSVPVTVPVGKGGDGRRVHARGVLVVFCGPYVRDDVGRPPNRRLVSFAILPRQRPGILLRRWDWRWLEWQGGSVVPRVPCGGSVRSRQSAVARFRTQPGLGNSLILVAQRRIEQ